VPIRTAKLAREFHSAPVRNQQAQLIPIKDASPETVEASVADVLDGTALKPAEVAVKLRCSVKSVHRIFSNMAGIVRTGKRAYLVPRSLLEAWLRQQVNRAA
jgi:hypothetical protein